MATENAGKRSPEQTQGTQPGSRWKRIMSWIGAVTAILGLVFGLQRLVSGIGDWQAKKHRITEMIELARTQQGSGHYPEAWASLADAERTAGDNDEVRQAQEDVAMVWLRAARVRSGEQTFTDLVAPLVPVLERGVLRAEGQRKADLLAHAGWADFLRWREGARELAPEKHYQQALESDTNNPFAHAMWGHWVLFSGRDLAAARSHFDAAIKAGREREYVRFMELTALLNVNGDAAVPELLRVSNERREKDEKLGQNDADKVLWLTCYSDMRNAGSWEPSTSRIPPREEIATLRWLFATANQEDSKDDMLDFCEARLHAVAGDTAKALGMLRELERNAEGDVVRSIAERGVAHLTGGSRF